MDASVYLLEYIRHRKNWETVLPWLESSLFDDDGALGVFRTIKRAMQYDDCKTIDYPQIAALSKEILKDPDTWGDVVKCCKRMAKVRRKKEVLIRMARNFLRNKHTLRLIEDAADDLGSGNDVDPSKLKMGLSKLETIGATDGVQIDIYQNPGAHFEDIMHSGEPVPTPIPSLTDCLDGGPCAGEVVTIMALPDGGKTLFLLDWAVTASENGIPTFVAVLERGRICKSRLYCRITRHSAQWLHDHRIVFEKQLRTKAEQNAPLRLMDYSRREASVSDLRRDIGRFVDDVGSIGCIAIDYGDLIRSSRRYDSKRHELDLVWVELSRMAQEFSAPVLVPTQSNRKGTQVNTLDMSNAAEAWAKMHTTDMVITLNQTSREKRRDLARLAVVKTKKTGGFIIVPVKFSRLKCLVTEVGDKNEERKGDRAAKKKKDKKGSHKKAVERAFRRPSESRPIRRPHR